MKRHSYLLAASFFGLIATPAFADSITPSGVPASIAVGSSASVSKTVTVSAGTPTSAKADIFFLTDTTGSMGSTIGTVQSNFTSIASTLTGNIAYGVGQFKDSPAQGDPFTYNLDQAITTNVASAQAAVNTWYASGGGDYPEQGLYGLDQVATLASTGWRDGAKKIIILSGDAEAKTDMLSQSAVVSDLIKNNVTVESIDVGSLNSAGQFDGPGSIYSAGVSGQYFTAFGSDLTAQIQAAIGSAFANYNDVTLQIVGGGPGLDIGFTPTDFSGMYDRSSDKTFDFGLTFTGITAGTYDFTINALVDGGIIASEHDSIMVTGGTSAVPEPASWALMIGGIGCAGGMLRRQRRVTTRIALA